MAARQAKLRDLGALQGDVLLFGGPYSNLQASQALLAVARALGIGPDRRICTGDVIAYCANPAETLALWQDNARITAGNCERQIAAGAEDCGCGFAPGSSCEVSSRAWFPHARAAISPAARQALAALPDVILFEHGARRYAVIHGGVSDVARYLWPVSPQAAFQREIDLLQARVGALDGVIAGHCGIAFERRIGAVHWINAGVIGMPPNDGTRQGEYAILGRDGLRFARLDYDARAARAAMIRAGLTQGYEEALLSGWWPSEDILPPEMRRQESALSCRAPAGDGAAPDP